MVSIELNAPGSIAAPLPPQTAPEPQYEEADAQQTERQGLTFSGVALAMCALSLGASTFPMLRPRLGELLLHPVHLFVPIVFLATAPKRLRLMPVKVSLAILACVLMFCVAALTAKGGWGPSLKITASALTIFTAAIAIRTEADFRAAVVCVVLAAVASSMRAFGASRGISLGVNPMSGIANKNGFSLYVLPALLLAGYAALQPTAGVFRRLLLAACMVVHVFAIFMTANRSGWLGTLVIGALLALRSVRRISHLILLAAVVGLVTYLFANFGDRAMVEHKIEQTREGYSSDTLRANLVRWSLDVALSNPVLGVSPQRLPREIARRSPIRGEVFETHNVFATIVGGGGLLLTSAFVALFIVLWQRPRGWASLKTSASVRDAHYLLRCMLILWCVRGAFSAEILHNPSFCFGVGLCIGLGMIRGLWKVSDRAIAAAS
jgi:O-antigen ligase